MDIKGSLVSNAASASWGEVATDSQGFFRLRVEASKARRDFRVLVRFKDKREDEMLAVNTPPGLGFTNSIAVVYPARVVSGSSYANGATRTAYIHNTAARDQWSVDTIVHEVMHLWNYQQTGVSNWLAAVCFDGNTHGFQEQPAIAFHEGFAEWAKNELMTRLWGRPRVRPTSRFGLAQRDLNDVDTLERSDFGVLAGLHLLTTPDIHGHIFGTSASAPDGRPTATATGPADLSGLSCPASPEIDLFDVLRVFLPHPAQGWPTYWQVGQKEFGLVEFYRRASDILPPFDNATKALYLGRGVRLMSVSAEPVRGGNRRGRPCRPGRETARRPPR